ncbi:MAG: peptidase S53 [Curvibacter sp.]|nr:MAG: peptidase S53 [Curvibacter sp.]
MSTMTLLLAACGGGDGGTTASPSISATTTLTADVDSLPESAATQTALPSFHLAPVQLPAPDDVDASGTGASAGLAPRVAMVPAELAGLSSRRLTPEAMTQAKLLGVPAGTQVDDTTAKAGTAVVTYTPAQIRAAYGLPAIPAAGTSLTAAQAAQFGAGQTIYIVDAMHNPNVAAELAAFNSKFGLPTCTTKAIATNATLPLAAPSASACELSVVYSNASAAMTATAPAYDSGWSTEISLDVQWAHAIAPLARLVLIEAPDSSVNNLLAAVALANKMGPGVVSMSFGANEGSWTASSDGYFNTANMTYLAAAGDSGAGVSWPAVSPKVLAVGGTSLTYSGSGSRSEVVWSGSGGGTSAYTPTPSYQTSAVPGMGTVARRTVSDVAMNANPNTGQYVAVIAAGSTATQWVSAGGTSMSTPQWAALMAVANAMRVQGAKALLGTPHSVLYGQISVNASSYAGAFLDVTTGNNGSCATCSAHAGFDTPTGLGTPNGSNLLSVLSGATVTNPPVVASASISGQVGTALSFTVSASAPNAVTYSLSGAPSGMTISTAGVVSWPTPVAGTYAVTVVAKDSKTGLSGQGVYTVTVTAPVAPTVTAATVNGTPGTALTFTVNATGTNALSYSLSGAPTGMSINASTGVVSWTSPVLGTYSVTAIAKDSKTGLSGQAVYTVKIAASTTTSGGLSVNAPAITGTAGKAVSGTITITDSGVSWVSVSISGAPLGMSFSMTGLTVTAKWPTPVVGSYTLTIVVADSAGRKVQVQMPVTIK